MAATRTTLKQYFKKYATPTEEQFAALIDAFVHKDEDSLTQSKIDGLTAALESKVSSSDLASAVATAVEETLQGGNIEVTPAAHQHAIADVEGLQEFVTKVNNFLESADVSDETINRWAEIETFLTGITDQETLTGLLLQLKNEILAQIPEPQTGIYLKQISDLDAYTEAQEGEIVQYVGSTTENYRRGFCYERKKELIIAQGESYVELSSSYITSLKQTIPGGRYKVYSDERTPEFYRYTSGSTKIKGIKPELMQVGDVMLVTESSNSYEATVTSITSYNFMVQELNGNHSASASASDGVPDFGANYSYYRSFRVNDNMIIHIATRNSNSGLIEYNGNFYYADNIRWGQSLITAEEDMFGDATWQPIATSPVVS